MKWNICRDGWDSPVAAGRFNTRLESQRLQTGVALWQRWSTDRLQLSRRALLLLLQGSLFTQLFDREVRLEHDLQCVEGPLVVLRCKLDPIWSAQSHVADLVLAQPLDVPMGTPKADLLSAMLNHRSS